ncbi:MAG: hypothetical protein IK093_17720 [Ruminiclostridium sp.]|nr:hypothetical protein [Ruminiclostridium sp.]
MRNRKFKGKYLTVNIQLGEISKANYITIAKCMLCLHTQEISKRMLLEMYEEYTRDWVPKYNELSKDDVMHEYVRRDLAAIGIDLKELAQYTEYGNVVDPKQRDALVDNFGIFCLYLNYKIGYGKKRLRSIYGMMKQYSKDPVEEIGKLLGIKVEEVLPDVQERLGKPEKIDRAELRRISQELEGLRAFQERSKK